LGPTTDNSYLTSEYAIEPIVWNITAPDSITLSDNGTRYIVGLIQCIEVGSMIVYRSGMFIRVFRLSPRYRLKICQQQFAMQSIIVYLS
jgi:hypothetical protein